MKPSIAEQIEAVRERIEYLEGSLKTRHNADDAAELAAFRAILATLSRHEALEAAARNIVAAIECATPASSEVELLRRSVHGILSDALGAAETEKP